MLTSSNLNNMYESCSFSEGKWELEELGEVGVDAIYWSYHKVLFGLNPVISAWIALAVISVVCTGIACAALSVNKNNRVR